MTLADRLLQHATGLADAPQSLQWLAGWLPVARRLTFTPDGLARIDAYARAGLDLSDIAPAALMLLGPVWYETTITSAGGASITMGYGAMPAPDGIDVAWACHFTKRDLVLGPTGPVRVTATKIKRPRGLAAVEWEKTRAAVRVTLLAILADLGSDLVPEAVPTMPDTTSSPQAARRRASSRTGSGVEGAADP